jgi:hypothetical protein
MDPLEAERLGLDELTELAGRQPADVLDAQPRILLHIARGCEPPAAIHRRASALNRALAALGEPLSDPSLAREVHAELARDLARDEYPEQAEALALAVLGQTPPAEERARGLSQQGDGPGTLAAILAVESFRSDWFDGCGVEFLADAADYLDRVGYRDLAGAGGQARSSRATADHRAAGACSAASR